MASGPPIVTHVVECVSVSLFHYICTNITNSHQTEGGMQSETATVWSTMKFIFQTQTLASTRVSEMKLFIISIFVVIMNNSMIDYYHIFTHAGP